MRNLFVAVGIGAATLTLALNAAYAAAPAAVVIKDATGASFTGDATPGERTFAQCKTCHSVQAGENRIGPSLFGVIGRKAGIAPNYNYSGAMKNSGLTWTEQTLADYLENPRKKVTGTKMTFAGLSKPQDRANVIAYLKKVGTK
jgi:cytochrome c